ncbi:MAG: hypothetical protein FH758_10150 [Firmicutes bacterium]|nr:hypothetical protein [Bacillota bacterium]
MKEILKPTFINNKIKKLANIYPFLRLMVYVSLLEAIIFTSCILLLSKFENLSINESIYLTIITVFTVGYGVCLCLGLALRSSSEP